MSKHIQIDYNLCYGQIIVKKTNTLFFSIKTVLSTYFSSTSSSFWCLRQVTLGEWQDIAWTDVLGPSRQPFRLAFKTKDDFDFSLNLTSIYWNAEEDKDGASGENIKHHRGRTIKLHAGRLELIFQC